MRWRPREVCVKSLAVCEYIKWSGNYPPHGSEIKLNTCKAPTNLLRPESSRWLVHSAPVNCILLSEFAFWMKRKLVCWRLMLAQGQMSKMQRHPDGWNRSKILKTACATTKNFLLVSSICLFLEHSYIKSTGKLEGSPKLKSPHIEPN